jgi:hypothetical protein
MVGGFSRLERMVAEHVARIGQGASASRPMMDPEEWDAAYDYFTRVGPRPGGTEPVDHKMAEPLLEWHAASWADVPAWERHAAAATHAAYSARQSLEVLEQSADGTWRLAEGLGDGANNAARGWVERPGAYDAWQNASPGDAQRLRDNYENTVTRWGIDRAAMVDQPMHEGFADVPYRPRSLE